MNDIVRSNHTEDIEENPLRVLDKLLKGYDRRSTPSSIEGAPTTVWTELYIASLGSINTENMVRITEENISSEWLESKDLTLILSSLDLWYKLLQLFFAEKLLNSKLCSSAMQWQWEISSGYHVNISVLGLHHGYISQTDLAGPPTCLCSLEGEAQLISDPFLVADTTNICRNHWTLPTPSWCKPFGNLRSSFQMPKRVTFSSWPCPICWSGFILMERYCIS